MAKLVVVKEMKILRIGGNCSARHNKSSETDAGKFLRRFAVLFVAARLDSNVICLGLDMVPKYGTIPL